MYGYSGYMLEIDLTNKTYEKKKIPEEILELYVGGKGLGVKLLYDNNPPGVDPFSPDNLLIFTIGPLTGSLVPQSNRFVVTTKSPLTGGIATSTSGGRLAFGIRKAGYDAIIIKGKAKTPTYLLIEDDKVEFKSARGLWGKGTYYTEEQLRKKHKGFEVACIGPAGENLVRFASIISSERAAGRVGVGAVMGSKKLKAIVINGSFKLPIRYPEKLKKYNQWFSKYIKKHPMMSDVLPRLGTANIVYASNGTKTLPTHNYKRTYFEDAWKISGEYMYEHEIIKDKNGKQKKTGCAHCPVQCGRAVKYKNKPVKGPEYETVALLGSNIENSDLKKIIEWNYLCDDYGMDTISTGGVLAFAMELTERKMLKSDLKFGKTSNISKYIKDIAYRKGLGNDLAEGVKRMSEKYGGKEFAIHVKGLELPAYDPRGNYAQGLEYLTTNRGGCHIQGASMYLETTGPFTIDPISTKSKAELAVMMQNQANFISSAVLCMFTAYAMIPPILWKLKKTGFLSRTLSNITKYVAGPTIRLLLKLKPKGMPMLWWEKWMTYITGRKITFGHVQEIGERIFNLERLFNLREGIDASQDIFPKRLLEETIYEGQKVAFPIDKLLPKYYKIRGWDKNGVPKKKTLKRLKIEA